MTEHIADVHTHYRPNSRKCGNPRHTMHSYRDTEIERTDCLPTYISKPLPTVNTPIRINRDIARPSIAGAASVRSASSRSVGETPL
jgi:hypothetical protein